MLFGRSSRPPLPSFLVIGAQKAGTSALFKMLATHPELLAPEVKEQHFFDREEVFALGADHYRAQFPHPSGRRAHSFEATPSYLYLPQVPARIHAMLPEARLIAILREPVSRAYSAWNMFRSFAPEGPRGHLHDPRPFAQAVEDEMAGRTPNWVHHYLDRGLYSRQLERYHALFPRERLLVVRYTELKRDPASVLERVVRHTGLSPFTFAPATLHVRDNVRAYPEPLDPTLADHIRRWYGAERDALSTLLGPDMDLFDL